jgi:NADH-quinone oxidoreductase subunit G
LKAAESPLVISGTSCGSDALIQAAANVAWALCRHGRPAGLSFIFPECNSLGLALLGGTPLGAAAKALQDGLTDTVIVLENDLYRRAEADVVEKLFGAAKHVIVLDHLANATTARAEVVLPAATFAEASGSLVNNEGRAQRFYRAFVPQSEVRESWQWLRDIMTAAGRSEATRWQTLDDVTAAMGEVLPVFAAVRDIAPPEGFRVAGSKIPRQPHRYSGRTAMTANCDVNEPQAPSDSDSALAFSMEGYEGQPPPALAARYWAPAWNSVQALNKFQAEVGGPLRGGNPGRRLIEPMSGGPSADFHVPLQKFKPRPGELLLVPAWHCFGSEELSAQSPGVASLSPSPYCGLSVADAGALGVKDGDEVELILAAAPGTAANDAAVAPGLRLPVKVIDGLAAGVAEVFAGTAGPAFLAWPAWAKVVRVASQGGRASA